jgi:site-specific DNA-cytosine methylase
VDIRPLYAIIIPSIYFGAIMCKPLDMSILTVGQLKSGQSRVWIASTAILKSMRIGEGVMVEYNKGSREVTISQADIFVNHSVSSRNGKDPIIDIKNKQVSEVFKPGDKIEVLYFANKIIVKIAKTQISQESRASKQGVKFFDLFGGSGTLSEMFKKAGFQPAGMLEYSEKFISMYRDNHGEDVYTIAAKIEDIMPEDFPKDIPLVTVGLPCTTFSNGNKQMIEELKKMRDGKEYDASVVAKRYEGEALTFHALNAIRAMNPKTVVIEEVEPYSRTNASFLMRTILSQMGFTLTETVSTGAHTKRKRWVLVAHLGEAINLSDLIADDGKVIGDFLETPIDERKWQTADENPRVSGMIRKGLGIRAATPNDKTVNCFTMHGTRHTEPCLRHPTEELYSEFTNQEIANIHGLNNFKLSGEKTLDRAILGQGVTDMFYHVALRVKSVLEAAA